MATVNLYRILCQDVLNSLILKPLKFLASMLLFGFGGLFLLTEGNELPGKFRAHGPNVRPVRRALRCLQRRINEKGRVRWRCLILAMQYYTIILRTQRFSSCQN